MNNHNHKRNGIKRRVIALVDREEMEFLEKLSMDSLFSTGRKLTKIDVIGALIDAAMQLKINAHDIHSKKELVEKIVSVVRNQIEKRKYPRIKKTLHIGFRKMDSLEQYKHSTTENIGIGGFRMDVSYMDKPPHVHQVIEVVMKDSHEKEPIKAIGRIAWVREKENDTGLEIGVMLTYIDKKDRERFEQYVAEEEKNGIEYNGGK